MNFLIISDIHCFHSSKQKGAINTTRLFSDALRAPRVQNPFEALLVGIENGSVPKPDCIICPGDITENCDSQGLVTGWMYINEIAQKWGGVPIYATSGNHDVDSHDQYKRGHLGILQGIGQNYPLDNRARHDSYWGKSFYLDVTSNYLILGMNSCHDHTSPEKAKRASIAHIDEIDTELAKFTTKLNRIALVHHHPAKHSNIDLTYEDGDVLDNGDTLISLLLKHDFDVLVHGHKHDARLNTINGLPILGSGSFSSRRNTVDVDGDNLVHHVFIDGQRKGRVQSYVYGVNSGWTKKSGRKFPIATGFGSSLRPNDLALLSLEWLKSIKDKETIFYADMVAQFPDMVYLTPSDVLLYHKIMSIENNIRFTPDFPEVPRYIENLSSLWT